MGVKNAQLYISGMVPSTSGNSTSPVQQLPTIVLLETDNTLAQVLATGYLNSYSASFDIVFSDNQMALVFTTDSGPVWLKIVLTAANTSLVYPSSMETDSLIKTGTLIVGNLLKVNNADGVLEDAGIAATALVLSSANAANQMAAGAVTYDNKGTGTVTASAVTINTQAGAITVAVSTAAGSTTSFTLNDSKILGTTNLLSTFLAGGTNTTLGVQLSAVTTGAGTATITIGNNHAADALNGNLIIGFKVL